MYSEFANLNPKFLENAAPLFLFNCIISIFLLSTNSFKTLLELSLESNDKNLFSIHKNEEIQINSSNPFLKEIIPKLPDPRIEILEKYIQSDSSTALELEKNILVWLDLLEQKKRRN